MKKWILLGAMAGLMVGCASQYDRRSNSAVGATGAEADAVSGVGPGTVEDPDPFPEPGARGRGELDLGPGDRDAVFSRRPGTGWGAPPEWTGVFMPDWVRQNRTAR